MKEAKVRPKKSLYKSEISWQGERKGVLSSLGKPSLEVSPPPEFKGDVGIWTPEDLLVASVNSCLMMTFLYYAAREGIKLISYESEAEGLLETVDRHLAISSVKIMPRISVSSQIDSEKIHSLLKLAEENCFISNSIKANIEITPEIRIKSLSGPA